MSQLSTLHQDLIALPHAKLDIHVRPAVVGDLAFIDDLQKANGHALGFQFEKALISRIEKGDILVAEMADGQPVGYVLGVDRYYKRDDVGIIYQMGVLPEYRRSLVAAHLLQARFDHSAYGCRLYCCWCAQDLTHANQFWEAMGFVPLAFRTGSEKTRFVGVDGEKHSGGRIHIFWQKRIRLGDVVTPWWYPSETSGGAIGANRIALPIPPGTHWSDAKPVVLPKELLMLPAPTEEEKALDEIAKGKKVKGKQLGVNPASGSGGGGSGGGEGGMSGFGASFGPSAEALQAQKQAEERVTRAKKTKKQAVKARMKANDPALCAFSRELRDRWQEHIVAQPGLIESAARARYEVGRLISPVGASPAGHGEADSPLDIVDHQSVLIEDRIPECRRLEAA